MQSKACVLHGTGYAVIAQRIRLHVAAPAVLRRSVQDVEPHPQAERREEVKGGFLPQVRDPSCGRYVVWKERDGETKITISIAAVEAHVLHHLLRNFVAQNEPLGVQDATFQFFCVSAGAGGTKREAIY